MTEAIFPSIIVAVLASSPVTRSVIAIGYFGKRATRQLVVVLWGDPVRVYAPVLVKSHCFRRRARNVLTKPAMKTEQIKFIRLQQALPSGTLNSL